MWKYRNIIDKLDTSIENNLCWLSMIVIKIWIDISNLFEISNSSNKNIKQEKSKKRKWINHETKNSKIVNSNNWISIFLIIISIIIPNSTVSTSTSIHNKLTSTSHQDNVWNNTIVWYEDFYHLIATYHELIDDWQKILSGIQNDIKKTSEAVVDLEIDNLRTHIWNLKLERENQMLNEIFQRIKKFIEDIRNSGDKLLLACESTSPELLFQIKKDIEYLKSLDNPKLNNTISIVENICKQYYEY